MRLKIRNGIIYDENGLIKGTAPDVTPETERTIEGGSEAIQEIEKFVEEVKNGSFKPRTVVKRFEQLLEKYAI